MPASQCDILIIGATTGGVAAALSIARLGRSCIMVGSSDWLGGQLTSQAVPPDENQWIETVGGTTTYQTFREGVREHYRRDPRLVPSLRAEKHLNPGRGWVSRLCFEPVAGERVLRHMLSPFITKGLVRTIEHCVPTAASTRGETIEHVTFTDLRDGTQHQIAARIILDATDLGDLYPLADIEHAIGAECKSVYGELHARDGASDALDQQPISWCFALEHEPGADHRIRKPAAYDFWRTYVPEHIDDENCGWPGPLFSWVIPAHEPSNSRTLNMIPWPDKPKNGAWELWRYRRIRDRGALSALANPPSDVCLVNWVQMDYWRKPLLGVTPDQANVALREAKEQSTALLYWMQTEAPRHDGKGAGYPGLKLCGDPLGTSDGFAREAYIREPRRLLARQMMHEGHLGTEQRTLEGRPNMDATEFGCGEPFTDSIGIGHYRIDLHPSCSGRGSVYVPAAPYRIPLGSLLPIRIRNVIAAGKAIGVTHVVNGATRMHHSEWNIGESAGALAAFCLQRGFEPHQVHDLGERVQEYQQLLTSLGVRIAWPWEH
ncbi:MAG: FAD-dependent oxidoreductase [Planctomycetes bacterium]|nr:FAD-dependent oxidoreductase [Planctomycetota bacterium]